ncbi:hypothetical protein B0H19DRAFT_1377102 [Mycena capillaripes]|nr:hypothetical protein B0H19DRAFT_1377102 [Mycena capillaripes]
MTLNAKAIIRTVESLPLPPPTASPPMDKDISSDPEFSSDSVSEGPGPASSSGMFSGAQNFVVTGQTLTNITNHYTAPPTLSLDFRRIPLGDIYLLDEVGSERGAHTIGRLRERVSVRRVYSARVEGRQSNAMVALYQGDGAEEEWRADITRYSWLRHPYFVQLLGITASSKMYAAVFHDDLVPFQHFLERYRHSHLLTVYSHAYRAKEFKEVQTYFESAFQRRLSRSECTFWLHRLTGRLCADLVPSEISWKSDPEDISIPREITPLNASNQEALIIDSLTLEQYHDLCYWDLSQFRQSFSSAGVAVKVGAIYSCSSEDQLGNAPEIAYVPDVEIDGSHWNAARGDVMENGWTRVSSGHVSGSTIRLRLAWTSPEAWLSQANHIFTRLNITSSLNDYVLVYAVSFEVVLSAITEHSPAGFLFLCTAKDFETGPSSFRWPDHPAYWSLDPFGGACLTAEEALRLGFPSIELRTCIKGDSWDAGVYAGLRQLHRAKGFDPDSQEIGRHLGLSLYQLSSELDPPFAYIDANDPCSEQADQSSAPSKDPMSKTFIFVFHLQLGLILFLSLCSMYEHVWCYNDRDTPELDPHGLRYGAALDVAIDWTRMVRLPVRPLPRAFSRNYRSSYPISP